MISITNIRGNLKNDKLDIINRMFNRNVSELQEDKVLLYYMAIL